MPSSGMCKNVYKPVAMNKFTFSIYNLKRGINYMPLSTPSGQHLLNP